ncbi:hypothetical protein [Sutterella megalosphaeroides]|nr:hypothetical protein [Sutterella megalosphaeroides]
MKDLTRTTLFSCLFGLLACASSVSAKDLMADAVPEVVRAYVQTTFGDIPRIEWDFDEDTNTFEADFELAGDREVELRIRPDGTLFSAKEDVPASEIPEYVKAAALKEIPGARILGANKLTDRTGTVLWDVGLRATNNGRFYRNVRIPEQQLKR